MAKNGWDDHAEYLQKSREFLWNDDYMAFLVREVWRIAAPVRIVDFGCGLGFLAEKLLPLCPEGSVYTGIDSSAALLARARENAAERGLPATFIEADLLAYEPEARFDIAICHTVLQHIPGAARVVEKMIASVVPGGMVICCEISRNIANAGIHFDGLDTDENGTLGILQKLWWEDSARGGGDHTIAVKLPALMRRLGLNDVRVRVNDFCQFIDPYGDRERHASAIEDMRLSGWGGPEGDRESAVQSLMSRGLTRDEAERQRDAESRMNAFVREKGEEALMLLPMFMLISFGIR